MLPCVHRSGRFDDSSYLNFFSFATSSPRIPRLLCRQQQCHHLQCRGTKASDGPSKPTASSRPCSRTDSNLATATPRSRSASKSKVAAKKSRHTALCSTPQTTYSPSSRPGTGPAHKPSASPSIAAASSASGASGCTSGRSTPTRNSCARMGMRIRAVQARL